MLPTIIFFISLWTTVYLIVMLFENYFNKLNYKLDFFIRILALVLSITWSYLFYLLH